MHVAHGRGFVFRCGMLCTFGFVNEVFRSVTRVYCRDSHQILLNIIKTSKCSLWVVHQERSLLSMTALLLRHPEGCNVLWRVCLSVCLSVRSHNSKTTRPILTKFSARWLRYGRGSVLLWLHCDTLSTSCLHVFVVWSQWARIKDDVMFR